MNKNKGPCDNKSTDGYVMSLIFTAFKSNRRNFCSLIGLDERNERFRQLFQFLFVAPDGNWEFLRTRCARSTLCFSHIVLLYALLSGSQKFPHAYITQ